MLKLWILVVVTVTVYGVPIIDLNSKEDDRSRQNPADARVEETRITCAPRLINCYGNPSVKYYPIWPECKIISCFELMDLTQRFNTSQTCKDLVHALKLSWADRKDVELYNIENQNVVEMLWDSWKFIYQRVETSLKDIVSEIKEKIQ